MPVENLVSNEVAWALDKLNRMYQDGEIKGLTIQVMLEDKQFITGHAGDLSFIEKLGLLESAKNNVFLSVEE